VTASLGGGVAYFITRNVSVETKLNVLAHTSTLGLGITYMPSVNFGFQIYLGKADKWQKEGQKH
jgi:hypothetical protein